ncbi:HAF repeat-containing protein [Janthinobacterium sp. SUN118]|uniref:HAF repeat-containing protein n=1 Tax=Janthinobacterium sp. SUN118 TaxID=3004100 RepID=UPI0025B171F2|nr:HAF repeat-containing protein [Janthinobacterium sp. SUN118]MDN2712539.1 HAF repeat-containing protein [Janthinobacterium sp. SUN118]
MPPRHSRACAPLLGLFLLAAIPAASAAIHAEHGFGEKDGNGSIASDLNPAGLVAGIIMEEAGRRRAVTYQHGRIRELGTLGGDEGFTKAINAHGVVVGSSQTASGAWHAFRYDAAGGMRDLGTLGGSSSYATAIARDGTVAGYADTSGGDFHAYVTKADHSLQDLGTLGGASSYASGLNNHGVVVGTAQRGDGYRRAFIYRPGTGMQEIGTLPGGRISSATAINDAGLVVGAAETDKRRWHAFAWDGRRMIDLGAMIGQGDSYATAVNAAGHVVGSVSINGFEPMTFVYKDGVMTVRRRDDGLYLTNKITDAGLVVGAVYTGHKFQAFAVPSQAAPAPPRRNPLDWFFMTVIAAASGAVLYRARRHFRVGLLGQRRHLL